MTDDELEIIGALAGCTFVPGHPHKRFVRDMLFAAEADPDRELTDRQRDYLYGLRWRYRRQIPDQVAGIVAGVAEFHAHRRRSAAVKVKAKPVDPQLDLPLWSSKP